jgi:hypothetical protein
MSPRMMRPVPASRCISTVMPSVKGIGSLSVYAASRAAVRSRVSGHVRRDLPVHQPLQKLTIAIACIGSDGLPFPALPLGEASDHILCGPRLLTQASSCRLHACDDAAVVEAVGAQVKQAFTAKEKAKLAKKPAIKENQPKAKKLA